MKVFAFIIMFLVLTTSSVFATYDDHVWNHTPSPLPSHKPSVSPSVFSPSPSTFPTMEPTPKTPSNTPNPTPIIASVPATVPPAPFGDGRSDGRTDSLGCQKASDNCNTAKTQSLPSTGPFDQLWSIFVITVVVFVIGLGLKQLASSTEKKIKSE